MKWMLVVVGVLAWWLSTSGYATPVLQSPERAQSNVPLPAESAGWVCVLSGLISAFDSVDIVALGEAHSRKVDSELRTRLVRHPDFPKKARIIVVEFANSLYQRVLDRCIQGDEVPEAELR